MTDTLPFIVSAPAQDNSMGLFSATSGAAVLKQIPVQVLRENLLAVASSLRAVLAEATEQAGGLRLKEAQVGLEISAEGGVQLIGTAQVGAKAAITLVFGD